MAHKTDCMRSSLPLFGNMAAFQSGRQSATRSTRPWSCTAEGFLSVKGIPRYLHNNRYVTQPRDVETASNSSSEHLMDMAALLLMFTTRPEACPNSLKIASHRCSLCSYLDFSMQPHFVPFFTRKLLTYLSKNCQGVVQKTSETKITSSFIDHQMTTTCTGASRSHAVVIALPSSELANIIVVDSRKAVVLRPHRINTLEQQSPLMKTSVNQKVPTCRYKSADERRPDPSGSINDKCRPDLTRSMGDTSPDPIRRH